MYDVLFAIPQLVLYVALGHFNYLLDVFRTLFGPQWCAGAASEFFPVILNLSLDYVQFSLLRYKEGLDPFLL